MDTERTCGGCTACCKTHGVYELSKLPGMTCQHCQIGVGCAIYAERPDECRRFKCFWLKGVGGPEYRPDKIGIVPEYLDVPDIGMVMWFREVEAGALGSELMRSWTRRNLVKGNSVVHVTVTGVYTLYLSSTVDRYDQSVAEAFGEDTRIVPFLPSILLPKPPFAQHVF